MIKNIVIISSIMLTSCAHYTASKDELGSSVNDLNACETTRICTVAGSVSVVEAYHVEMSKIELASGACVLVSLPKNLQDRVKNGQTQIKVTGKLYYPPADDEWVGEMKIAGRRIGWGVCSKYIVFVK